MKIFVRGIKFSAKEVPYAGQAVAMLDVIYSTSKFYNVVKTMLSGDSNIVKLLDVDFTNGPDNLPEFVKKLNDHELMAICKIVPRLFDDLQNCICDWIATIPHAGPIAAELVRQITNFNAMKQIYSGLPKDMSDVFQRPEKLIDMVNLMINTIRSDLIGEQQAGGLLSMIGTAIGNVAGSGFIEMHGAAWTARYGVCSQYQRGGR
jgi:hypothetical protein